MIRAALHTSILLLVVAAANALAAPPSPCVPYDPLATNGQRFAGTAGKQTLVINYFADYETFSVDCNGDGDFTDIASGDRLDGGFSGEADIRLGGNDTIVVNVNAAWTDQHRKLSILLGPGTNNVTFNFTSQTLTSSSLLVDLVGGAGTDNVSVINPPLLSSSGFSLRADLGPGNDSLAVKLPRVIGEAQFDLDVNLGAGNNSLILDQGHALMSGNGAVHVSVLGGAGVDTVKALLDGYWAGASQLVLATDLGAGNDVLAVTLFCSNTASDFRIDPAADVKLFATGGIGNDSLSVVKAGTTAPFVDGRLDVDLQGGVGNDTITSDLALNMFGTLRLRAKGGAGNDVITATVDSRPSPPGSAPTHDVFLSGGAGNDTLTYNPFYGSGSVFVGFPALDGSFGTLDKCVVGGTFSAHIRGCEL